MTCVQGSSEGCWDTKVKRSIVVTSHTDILHSYGDVTSAGKGFPNVGLWSAQSN